MAHCVWKCMHPWTLHAPLATIQGKRSHEFQKEGLPQRFCISKGSWINMSREMLICCFLLCFAVMCLSVIYAARFHDSQPPWLSIRQLWYFCGGWGKKKEANNLVTPEGILSISLIQMRWRYVVCFVETSYYANMLWSVFHEVVSRWGDL